ncbi:MAG: hypothetical protein R3B06_31210 [Kofleriaceae bacterium]
MLSVYLVALGFGGTLLVASLLFGGDNDGADHGGADGGSDGADGGGGGHGGVEVAWAAARSLRFWTFVFGFGGAVGALLTGTGAGSAGVVAAAAGATGLAAGAIAVAIVRATAGGASSVLAARELAGRSATVTVAIAPGGLGKVRVAAGDRLVDLVAEADEALAIGATVLIVGAGDGGRVMVTRAVG